MLLKGGCKSAGVFFSEDSVDVAVRAHEDEQVTVTQEDFVDFIFG